MTVNEFINKYVDKRLVTLTKGLGYKQFDAIFFVSHGNLLYQYITDSKFLIVKSQKYNGDLDVTDSPMAINAKQLRLFVKCNGLIDCDYKYLKKYNGISICNIINNEFKKIGNLKIHINMFKTLIKLNNSIFLIFRNKNTNIDISILADDICAKFDIASLQNTENIVFNNDKKQLGIKLDFLKPFLKLMPIDTTIDTIQCDVYVNIDTNVFKIICLDYEAYFIAVDNIKKYETTYAQEVFIKELLHLKIGIDHE